MPPNCAHHWLIEQAHGPTSQGICKLCGKEKTFKNSDPEDKYFFDFENHRQKEIVLDGRVLIAS